MKRFITYVYVYENGVKGKNAGFIKAEQRDGIVKMEMQFRGLGRFQGKAKLDLIVPDQARECGIRIPFGTVEFHRGMANTLLEDKETRIASSKYDFSQVVGVRMELDDTHYLASCWVEHAEQYVCNLRAKGEDRYKSTLGHLEAYNSPARTIPGDQCVCKSTLGHLEANDSPARTIPGDQCVCKSTLKTVPVSRNTSESPMGTSPVSPRTGESPAKTVPVKQSASKSPAGTPRMTPRTGEFPAITTPGNQSASESLERVTPEDQRASEPPARATSGDQRANEVPGGVTSGAQRASESLTRSISGRQMASEPPAITTPEAQRVSESPMKSASRSQRSYESTEITTPGEQSAGEAPTESTSGRQMTSGASARFTPAGQYSSESPARFIPESRSTCESASTPQNLGGRMSEKTGSTTILEKVERQIREDSQKVCVPSIDLRKIDIADIRKLPRQNWYLCNNSFLIHGFFNYHHLMVKRVTEASQTKYYLGVPGVYEKPERMMALLFGFPEFEAVAPEQTPADNGRFRKAGSCQEENRVQQQEMKTGSFGYWYCLLDM